MKYVYTFYVYRTGSIEIRLSFYWNVRRVSCVSTANNTEIHIKATATMGPEGFRTEIRTGQAIEHTLIADEPKDKGTDDGPTPIEMLAGAIASCTTLTLRSYANLKEIKIDGVDVDV